MENAILFLCDIYGTIEGKIANTEADYSELNNLLNLISEQNTSSKIIFTLVSSENVEKVKQTLYELKNHLKNNVYFKKQFYEKGYILDNIHVETISGKCNQIIDYVQELKENTNLKMIYYADDSILFQTYVREIFDFKGIEIPLIPIISIEKIGLKELNKLINTEIIEKNIHNK